MDRFLQWCEYIGMGLIAVMGLLTGIDVIGRYFFNAPINGSLELIQLLFCCLVSFSLAVVTAHNGNVMVDMFVAMLSPSLQRFISVFSSFAGLILFVVFGWQCTVYAFKSLNYNELSDVLGIPIYPVKFLLAFGFMLTAVVSARQTYGLFRSPQKGAPVEKDQALAAEGPR